jgi:phosphoribosylanthranilate isomerase
MSDLKIKVCGMRDPENIRAISSYGPDYMGFIFYNKSPRFVGDHFDTSVLDSIPQTIKKVGVFVNEDIDKLVDIAEKYHLDYLQLHGDESIEYCQEMKERGYKIIKAISINSESDVIKSKLYSNVVDYILFDTGGKNYGGNGMKFNWDVLKSYDQNTPFFLGGGLGLDDLADIRIFRDLGVHSLDINSGFEEEPGMKDLQKVQKAIKRIKEEVYE